MRKAVWVVGVLALAGCDKPAEAPAQAPAAETAAPGASAATPQRKPGLWEQRVSMGDFVQVSRICLDTATDAKMGMWGQQATKDMCEKNLVSPRVAGGWQFSSVCNMGSGGVVTTVGTATGDFNSHYQVQAQSSTVGAAGEQLNGARKMVIDAAWQGACPEGWKPGDMSLPGGVRINMLDMGGGMPKAP